MLAITPGQLRKAGREDAARILAAAPEPPAEQPSLDDEIHWPAGGVDAKIDWMIRSMGGQGDDDKEDHPDDGEANGSRRAG